MEPLVSSIRNAEGQTDSMVRTVRQTPKVRILLGIEPILKSFHQVWITFIRDTYAKNHNSRHIWRLEVRPADKTKGHS